MLDLVHLSRGKQRDERESWQEQWDSIFTNKLVREGFHEKMIFEW